MVRPETILRWHRRGWRHYWRWRSGTHLGRPRLSREIRELIATMASQNPLWGTERIRGELIKLGIVASSRSMVRAAVPGRGFDELPPDPGGRGMSGHLEVHQLAAAVADKDLIHDHDRVWGGDFGRRTSGLGIKSLRTPIQAPRANAAAERWVRTARRECLDHLIPLSERHLRVILQEFVHYYNHDRPHRSLGLRPPAPRPHARLGAVSVRPVLGGLHHVYERAA